MILYYGINTPGESEFPEIKVVFPGNIENFSFFEKTSLSMVYASHTLPPLKLKQTWFKMPLTELKQIKKQEIGKKS